MRRESPPEKTMPGQGLKEGGGRKNNPVPVWLGKKKKGGNMI